MKTAGLIIIVLACLGIALSFTSQVSSFVVHRGRMGVLPWAYFLAAQPFHIMWVFVGLGFIALDNKLDKIASRSQ
jgi:uncharacterized membrane protein